MRGGIEMVKSGRARYLLITGGSGSIVQQDRKEATYLKQFAIRYGIPEEKIIIDDQSRNTFENARNTAVLMKDHNLTTALLITSAFHMPRAELCFIKQGLSCDTYPVDFLRPSPENDYSWSYQSLLPSSSKLERVKTIWKELLGRVAYAVNGYT